MWKFFSGMMNHITCPLSYNFLTLRELGLDLVEIILGRIEKKKKEKRKKKKEKTWEGKIWEKMVKMSVWLRGERGEGGEKTGGFECFLPAPTKTQSPQIGEKIEEDE